MNIYRHGSHNQNINTAGQVTCDGLFGSFLFFIGAQSTPFGTVDYEIDIDELNIARMFDLKYDVDYEVIQHVIADLADHISVDEETAFDLIVEDRNWTEIEHLDGEDGWLIQRAACECAKADGFDGIALNDENGDVIAIDMMGRETMLKKVD